MKVDDIERFLATTRSVDLVKRVFQMAQKRLVELDQKTGLSTKDVFSPTGEGGKTLDEEVNPGADLNERP